MKLITPLHRFFCLALLVSALCTSAFAQNNSNFKIHFSTETADTGDTVCVAVRAFGFKDIVSMQFGVKWPASQLAALKVDMTGGALANYQSSDHALVPGFLRTTWGTPTGFGVTLPDSALLFNLCFRVNGALDNSMLPVLLNTDDFPFEVIQEVSPTDWILVPPSQKSGGVFLGALEPSIYPRVSSSQVQQAHCQIHDGRISISIDGGLAPYQCLWSGPNGFVSTQKTLDSLEKGTYMVAITDQANIITVEEFAVKTAPSTLLVALNTKKNAFCGGANGCLQLSASNGVGPYTFKWSDGVDNNNQRCDLRPGQYTVTVIDAVGCQQTKLYVVGNDTTFKLQITGNTELYSCQQSGALKVNMEPSLVPEAQFLWSTGATTQEIGQLLSGTYKVTVTSALGCSAVQKITIYDNYFSNSRISAVPTCSGEGTLAGTIILKSINPNTMEYPVTVSWSDGSLKIIPQNIGTNMDTLKNVPQGAYAATITDANGCSKLYQTALACGTVVTAEVGNVPFFYLEDTYPNTAPSADSCVEVRALHFKALTTVELGLMYESAQQIPKLKLGDLPGLNFTHLTSHSKSVVLRWRAPGEIPVTLPDSTVLFKVCFTGVPHPYNANPSMGLRFNENAFPARVLGTLDQELPMACCSHYSLIVPYWSKNDFTVCNVQVTTPSCNQNGYSSIKLVACNPQEPLNGSFVYQKERYPLQSLQYAGKGTHFITNNKGNLITETLVKIPYQPLPSTPCTWPGDADDNNAVNHHDLLYLGLAYQSEGPARANAQLDWEGQDAPTWTRQIPGRKVDYRNIDTNGDGHIDAADTLAIARNWGRVVNTAVDDPFNIPTGVAEGHNPPPLQLKADTLAPGQTALLPLAFGSPTAPVDSFYGLAFSISYDPRFFNPDTRFYPTPSWMGQPQELLWMQRNFPEQGRLDIAITRTDGRFVSGGGPIGNLLVSIRNDVFGPKNGSNGSEFEADSLQKTSLFFGNPQCLNAQGDAGPVKIKPAELVIRKPTSVAADEPDAWARALVLSPNPAAGAVRIQSPGIQMERVEILDVNGRRRAEALATGTAATCQVDFLPPGTYWVRVFATAGVALKKLVVARQ